MVKYHIEVYNPDLAQWYELPRNFLGIGEVQVAIGNLIQLYGGLQAVEIRIREVE